MKTVIDLPYQIELEIELATAGSRSLALLADLLIGGLILFVPYALLFLTARDATQSWLGQFGVSTVSLIFILLVFGFQWGYFNLFEWLWNGQTPGKRILGLRVIRANGAPVSWSDVLLRNLARPLDTFLTLGLVGLILVFTGKRAQRLGDILAQTIVIRETRLDWDFIDHVAALETSVSANRGEPILLPFRDWEILESFLLRQRSFPEDSRKRIAAALRRGLHRFVGGTELERSQRSDEQWLWELARRAQPDSKKF